MSQAQQQNLPATNQQNKVKKPPKNLKSYELNAWEILNSQGVNYNDWKKEQLDKEKFELLQGNNTKLEAVMLEQICNELVEKELPKILTKMKR